ncbi:hypothetical protein [Amycolatopsis sp. DSM 110486]|uniref:hypothetical protein n=1 Tax=Amycolatopsis sp. DSM 110486 TaxID=2865832 RepID=UPI001C6A80D1|nr:hypothetical protein [Amycolatopsis sp. DSM 110486]QYN17486.1 hypothetical protein K1T34_32390 [Amycolatopsis sp. DSM 110486]
MTTHTATLVASHYNEADYWDTPSQYNPAADGTWVTYRIYSRYQRRTLNADLMYVGPDGEARHESGGPILPGPYVAVISHPPVISAYSQKRPVKVIELNEGDIVTFNGQPMVLKDDRRGYNPYFAPVTHTAEHDDCAECLALIGAAYGMAKATGSTSAQHIENGHAATVTR